MTELIVPLRQLEETCPNCGHALFQHEKDTRPRVCLHCPFYYLRPEEA